MYTYFIYTSWYIQIVPIAFNTFKVYIIVNRDFGENMSWMNDFHDIYLKRDV